MTGTLIELASDLTQRAERLKAVKTRQQLHQQLASRADTLSASALAVAEVVTSINCAEKLFPQTVKKLKASVPKQMEAVSKLRVNFIENPATLLGNELPDTLRIIDKVMDQARDSIRQDWRRHVESLIPSLPEVVLDILATDPAQTEAVGRIKEVSKKLKQLRDRFPITTTDMQELNNAKMALKSVQQNLENAEVPSDVLQFLQDCTVGGASLTKLTPTVLDWLSRHAVAHAFTVTVRRN